MKDASALEDVGAFEAASAFEDAGAFEAVNGKMKEAPQPDSMRPMLAVTARPGAGLPAGGWIFEPKLDGQRCLAFRRGGRARLVSRNGKNINGNYPELLRAVLAQPARDFIVDGEIVAFKGSLPSFAALQPRMQIADPVKALLSGIEVFYYLFDLLYFEGHDLTALPLSLRKAMLGRVIYFTGPLRETPWGENGRTVLDRECRKGGDGAMAKRAGSVYVRKRSADWLKFKCASRQEFVIGGYTDPAAARGGLFGALLVGYYRAGRLLYAGRVGTGFDFLTRKDLMERLRPLGQDAPPFAAPGEIPGKGVHWVRPELVCEVRFREWTKDGLLRRGLLRHPSFKGLRFDKRPREVRKET
ncbi:MAG: non-homologous end-joining DNA ligase [Nitrospiraceae bacterium]|nr:non-homologous end-joining DNA ligase [Nitrospiraceae bacterium]